MNKILIIIFVIFTIVILTITSVVFYKKGKIQTQCQVQNCHGLEVSCGPKAAQMCTEIYMEGDRCRKFVSCQLIDNQCEAVKQKAFFACKTCIEKCHREFNGKDPALFFDCEKKCGEV